MFTFLRHARGIAALVVIVRLTPCSLDSQVPQAAIQATPALGLGEAICENQEWIFTSDSDSITTGATFEWNFGTNGVPSSTSGPGPHTVLFSSAGCQWIELTVDNNNGMPLGVDSLALSIIDLPPLLELNLPDGERCAGESFELLAIDTVFSPNVCGDSLHRFWIIDSEVPYSINIGVEGHSNGYIGSNYDSEEWDSGTSSLNITVLEPGAFGAWFYAGSACDYDSVYFSSEILPAGELMLQNEDGGLESPQLTMCSGETIASLTLDSSIPGDTIFWSIVSYGNLNGISEFSGFGPAPLALPQWTIVNPTISSQTFEIEVGLTCNPNAGIIEIEVMPEIEIYLSPSLAPDTICSGEQFFAIVNTTVHDVLVSWSVDTLSEVIGGAEGLGPVVFDELMNVGDEVESLFYTFTTAMELCPADTLVYEVVVVPEFEVPEIVPLEACPGDELTLSSYELPFNEMEYSWSISGDSVGLASSGSSYLEAFIASNMTNQDALAVLTVVADLHGCSAADSLDVIVHPQPEIEVVLNSEVLCSGGELDASIVSSVPNIALVWSASPHPTISGMSSGQGMVPTHIEDSLTNVSNVLDSVLYIISTLDFVCPAEPYEWQAQVAPSFELPMMDDQQLCPGDSVLVPSQDLGIPALEYVWFYDGDFIGLEDEGLGILDHWPASNLSDSTASVANITLIAGAFGCQDTTAFTVLVEPKPSLNLVGFSSPKCSGVPLDWEVSSSVVDAIIHWVPSTQTSVLGANEGQGNVVSDTLFNGDFNLDSLTYSIFTDDSFCASDTLMADLVVLPSHDLPHFEDISLCNGDFMTAVDESLSIDSIVYSWSNSNIIVGLQDSGLGAVPGWTASNLTDVPVQTVIEIQAALFDCPVEVSSFTITVNPTPQLSFNVGPNGGLDCQTGLATLEGFPGFGPGFFSWSGPGEISPVGSTAQVDAVGIYVMEFIDESTGCFASTELTVSDPIPLTLLGVNVDSLACFGDTNGNILLDVEGGEDLYYDWSPSISSSNLAENVSAGVYDIVVTNASNCQDSATVELHQRPPLEIELLDSGVALCGVSNGYLEVDASGGSGGYVYQWENGFGALLTEIYSGTYNLIVTDALGCEQFASYDLICFDEIPIEETQIITPNNDGLNDALYLENLYLYPQHRIRIYNRWGALVYEASPYENNWQGTWEANGSGEALPSATYYFLIETEHQDALVFRGFVEIHNEAR
ncbi:gliding motility-associated C-terminal domain-containing protein [Flavobacteriales bacterium]|nr:gliding motility-associated C-terminal domain-containing protein [Flavobacteriales bacterium]MDB4493710.1 gliding motility-associated C-terminal domain-containing protein [Flavobacteriales bacterium]